MYIAESETGFISFISGFWFCVIFIITRMACKMPFQSWLGNNSYFMYLPGLSHLKNVRNKSWHH